MSNRWAARAPFAVALVLAMLGGAAAQSQQSGDGARPSAGIRDPYITSTGETVDRPGQSQSGGNTRLDRGIQRENNKIDRSICKGC